MHKIITVLWKSVFQKHVSARVKSTRVYTVKCSVSGSQPGEAGQLCKDMVQGNPAKCRFTLIL